MFNEQIVWLRGALHGDGPKDIDEIRERLEAWDDPRLWRYASEALKRRRGSPAIQKLQLLATLQLEETPPTLWLSSWFKKAPRGPGKTWNMDRKRPKSYLDASGLVLAVTPGIDEAELLEFGSHDEAHKLYDRAMAELLEQNVLTPGKLNAIVMEDPVPRLAWGRVINEHSAQVHAAELVPVRSGDTLRSLGSTAAAQRGRTARAWAVPWLQAAGWRVILDGDEQ